MEIIDGTEETRKKISDLMEEVLNLIAPSDVSVSVNALVNTTARFAHALGISKEDFLRNMDRAYEILEE